MHRGSKPEVFQAPPGAAAATPAAASTWNLLPRSLHGHIHTRGSEIGGGGAVHVLRSPLGPSRAGSPSSAVTLWGLPKATDSEGAQRRRPARVSSCLLRTVCWDSLRSCVYAPSSDPSFPRTLRPRSRAAGPYPRPPRHATVAKSYFSCVHTVNPTPVSSSLVISSEGVMAPVRRCPVSSSATLVSAGVAPGHLSLARACVHSERGPRTWSARTMPPRAVEGAQVCLARGPDEHAATWASVK